MYIRKIRSRRSTCFQIGEKISGRFVVRKHAGCATTPEEIEALFLKAKQILQALRFEHQIPLLPVPSPVRAIRLSWHITGYHTFFGSVYDRIGFPPRTLLRDLVVARIVHPASKCATLRYLNRELGVPLEKNQLFRFLDTLSKDDLSKIAYTFVSARHPGGITVCFYDVTTLHFETPREDDVRQKGFSKNHRSDVPQILIGLFVDEDGFPFDFQFYEGHTFEGHTFQDAVTGICRKYPLPALTVVADAGMLSEDNLAYLEQKNISYIVGARIKHLPAPLTASILAHDYTTEPIFQAAVTPRRFMVDYAAARAKLDAANRKKIVDTLTRRIKQRIPVVRKSKYITVSGTQSVTGIDRKKVSDDARFDGLKGYVTNTDNSLEAAKVITQYHRLWQVEKSFRMSKHDLRERPIFHRLKERIEAHLTLCFVSLLVLREAERLLKTVHLSPEQAIEHLGAAGEGTVRVGSVVIPMDSEPDPTVQVIHTLLSGH